jgi:nucleoside-diphosphate-sugar epimerase
VLPWLLNQGHQILNFDLHPFAHPSVMTLLGDITDGAQVFNAMTTHFGPQGLQAGKAPAPVDAVVHFAAVPRIFINPDNETYRVNVMGTYNVLETAMKRKRFKSDTSCLH